MIIQNKTFCLLVAATCATTLSLSAQAERSFSNARGGSASASMGSRSAETARGGSANWSRDSGTSVETANGRSASTSSTAYRTPAQGAAYRTPGGYPGAPAVGYPGYHPPAPAYGYHAPAGAYYDNNNYSSGQVAGAAAVGLAVGAMAGSAAANNNQAPATTTVVVQQAAPAPASGSIPLGTSLDTLPAGCSSSVFNGVQYYQCGINWFRAYLGSNGAYYQVVPAPY